MHGHAWNLSYEKVLPTLKTKFLSNLQIFNLSLPAWYPNFFLKSQSFLTSSHASRSCSTSNSSRERGMCSRLFRPSLTRAVPRTNVGIKAQTVQWIYCLTVAFRSNLNFLLYCNVKFRSGLYTLIILYHQS